jgi:hypothetical protein
MATSIAPWVWMLRYQSAVGPSPAMTMTSPSWRVPMTSSVVC